MYRTTEDLRHRDLAAREGVRDATRFSVAVSAGAVGFLVVAVVWVGTCGGSTYDTVACGTPQLTLLALGGPLILLAGAMRAFFRTYQLWRRHDIWWPWQAAGWFQMAATLLLVVTSVPSIATP